MKLNKAIFIALSVVVLGGFGYILINGEPNPIKIYTYEIEIPEHVTATHVKTQLAHYFPGIKEAIFNLKRQEIPEDRIIVYELDYPIKNMGVYFWFYKNVGSGFKLIDQEGYWIEF